MRKSAPTHPHPVIPRRPPGNAVMGVPLSLYDRLRDLLGLDLSTTALQKVLPGLLGLAITGVAAAILRKRH
ncbi:hypothetical protein [Streptomyces sp. enrichment culture]|uniref:hypothetical protein n=1 Tax=Streptomyces sp. enrichment culture TaxID=1795815 RepID=UPI003F552530